jgi:hypothetical protein
MTSRRRPRPEPPRQIRDGDGGASASTMIALRTRRQGRVAGNLPLALTGVIGRHRDVTALDESLATSRLVTLTGPGGVGKTRLALEVAVHQQDARRDGAWLVDLSVLADETDVPRAVADALAVRERPRQTLADTLAEALRARDLLLLLDNCEHVVQASARLVEALLRACPGLSVLATSREALAIGGEIVWDVAPLAIPPSMTISPSPSSPTSAPSACSSSAPGPSARTSPSPPRTPVPSPRSAAASMASLWHSSSPLPALPR